MDGNGQKSNIITQNDIMAIASILAFYERHLWNFATPSAKRTRQITEIQFLLVKIQFLSTTKIAELSSTDVSYIEAALSTFMKQTKEKIPQSKSRDEILENCEILHDYFVKFLAGTH